VFNDRVFFCACLAGLIVVQWLAMRSARKAPALGVSKVLIGVACLCCAGLTWLPLQTASHDQLGGLRTQLEGASIDIAHVGAGGVTVGPDPSRDWIVVPFASAHAVRLSHSDKGVKLDTRPPLDNGRLWLNGGPVTAPQTRYLADGDSLNLKIDSAPRGKTIDGREGRRRSSTLHLALKGDRLSIGLAQPEVAADIRAEDLNTAYSQPNNATGTITLAIGALAGGAKQNQIVFRAIGAPLSALLDARVSIGRDARSAQVVSADGMRTVAFGQSFATGGPAEIVLRVERKDLDWRGLALTGWLPLALVFATFVGAWKLMRRSAGAMVLISLATALAGLRLLIGEEGGIVAQSPTYAYVTRDSLAVLAFAPLVVAMACARGKRPRLFIAWAAVVLAALILIWTRYAPAFDNALAPVGWLQRLGGPTLLLGAACAVGVIAWPLVRRLAGVGVNLWRRLAQWLARFGSGVERIGSRLPQPIWTAIRESAPGPFAVLVALAVVRAGFAAIGWAENIGDHILLSTFTTPILVAASAWASVRIGRRIAATQGGVLAETLFWWGGMALAMGVIFVVCKDRGYVMTNLLPFVLWGLLIAALQPGRWSWTKTVMVAPGAACLAAVALYLVMAMLAPNEAQIEQAIRTPKSPASIALLGKLGRDDSIRDRVDAFLNPRGFETLASTAATENRAIFRALRVYAQPTWGRGFMNIELPQTLQRVQMSDNVPAIHLMSPFGRVGGVLFLWLVGFGAAGLSIAALRRVRWKPLSLSFAQSAAVLALWSVFLVDLYMMLANVQLMAFTGRDLYLMSPISVSDALEALTLLAIAGYGFSEKPQ
jgi:hypothetical protein